MIRNWTVGTLLGLIALSTRAETWLDVHLYALHTTPTYLYKGETIEFNNNTPGLGIDTSINANNSVIFGAYRNSFHSNTLYVGGDIHTSTPIQFGLNYGVVTGYENTLVTNYKNYKIYPAIMPNIVVKYKSIRLKVGYVPKINGVTHVITSTIGYKF